MRLHNSLLTAAVQRSALIAVGILLGLGGTYMAQQIRGHTKPVHFQPRGITAAWIPDTVTRWQQDIETQAKRYDVDPNLIAIIMTLESGGDPTADSGQAEGLMQITPITAKEIAAMHLQHPITTNFDIWDPATNVEFGVAYLAYLRHEFAMGNSAIETAYTVELVAAGYNGGPGAANSVYLGRGLTDTQTVVYSRDAFNMWRERVSKTSPTYSRWLERGGQALIDAAKKAEK